MPFLIRPSSRFPVQYACTYKGYLTTGGLVTRTTTKWARTARWVCGPPVLNRMVRLGMPHLKKCIYQLYANGKQVLYQLSNNSRKGVPCV